MVKKVRATAPGKVILFGEHAVVYGRPAIAVPISQVRAIAEVQDNPQGGIRVIAPDLDTDKILIGTDEEDPLAAALNQIVKTANLVELPDMIIKVNSQIPIASGLGSGAAITAAAIRAIASYLGLKGLITNEWVSALTYEVEKIHHGTPSGIDNTVVTYEQPVYFVRQQPKNKIETFQVASTLRLLIADTGIRSSTKTVVTDVRRQWQADPDKFEALFDECGRIANAARHAIEQGDIQQIGRLMTENQVVLREMTVSSPELDRLIQAAVGGGALGAKLSGAGRGGNMIALVTSATETTVYRALQNAGATSILLSEVN